MYYSVPSQNIARTNYHARAAAAADTKDETELELPDMDESIFEVLLDLVNDGMIMM